MFPFVFDFYFFLECLIVGTDTNCNCSTNYLWSNEVCYNYNCCSDATCTKNVSYMTPLCSPKVQGRSPEDV